MMISPETYLRELKKKPYPELIKYRDQLIQFIHEFEEKEKAGDRSDPEWHCSPSPEVRYQVYLEYLAGLCTLMQDRYNEEYVFGKKTLKKDMMQNCLQQKDSWTVEYTDGSGLYIVRLAEKKYYYGNGKDTNGIGIAANQFLRFNPYMDYVESENVPVPEIIREWIEAKEK